MSIKYKIILSISIIVFFVTSIISYNYIKYTQENMIRLSVKQLESIGYITLERLKEYLIQNEEKVRLFNSRLLFQKVLLDYKKDPDKKLNDMLKNILKLSYTEHGNIEDIIILDTNAKMIVSRSNNAHISEKMMKKMSERSLKSTYSHLSFINEEKIPLLCVSSPVFKDKEFVGTTIFKINLYALNQMLVQREGLDNSGEALFGTYAENDDLVLFTPLRFAKSPLMISKEDSKSAIPMKTVLDKKEHFIMDDKLDYRKEKVVSSVYYFEPLNIGIVVKKDIKEIMLPIEELKEKLFQIALLGIFLSIIVSYVFSLYIIRFVNHILDVASKISNGDFNQRIEVSTNDEIGMISNAVNKMANSLVKVNSKLENRVEEKTLLLQEANNKLNYIFNITPNITIVTNGETIVKANNEFFKFTGFNNLEEFFKKYNCICDMFIDRPGYLRSKMGNNSWVEYVAAHPKESHKVVINKNGHEYMFLVNATSYIENKKTNYIAVFENITEIQKVAYKDQLTKLANRLKIDEMLQRCFQSSKRYERDFSIILIDIDFFKKVNDDHGHLIGDEVLKSISKILSDLTRSVDLLGRWGGEEFIIISKETDINGAYSIGEKIRRAVEGHIFEEGLKQTISVGVTQYKQGESIDDMIKRADEALYAAKAKGRNRVEAVN